MRIDLTPLYNLYSKYINYLHDIQITENLAEYISVSDNHINITIDDEINIIHSKMPNGKINMYLLLYNSNFIKHLSILETVDNRKCGIFLVHKISPYLNCYNRFSGDIVKYLENRKNGNILDITKLEKLYEKYIFNSDITKFNEEYKKIYPDKLSKYDLFNSEYFSHYFIEESDTNGYLNLPLIKDDFIIEGDKCLSATDPDNGQYQEFVRYINILKM